MAPRRSKVLSCYRRRPYLSLGLGLLLTLFVSYFFPSFFNLRSPHSTASGLHLASGRPGKYSCPNALFLGDQYGGWTTCIPPKSLQGLIVYTVGVGRNIEWDKAMIHNYGTIHHGWDPTPTAPDFISKNPPPKGFIFHPYGLGTFDGTVSVKLPVGNNDSYTIMENTKVAKEGTVNEIEIRTVPTMMKMLGHSRLFILKIDIEGAEFDLIDHWVKTRYRVPAEQVLIEFHARYFPKEIQKELEPRAVLNMWKLGFSQYHRTRWEIAFMRNA